MIAGAAMLLSSGCGIMTAQAERPVNVEAAAKGLWEVGMADAGALGPRAADAGVRQEALRARWDALRAGAPDAVGALRVAGTPVDEVVVRPRPDDPDDFYLDHASDRTRNWAGSAYQDRRAGEGGLHRLVLAHHLGTSARLFSPLYDRWRPERFCRLGTARWIGPDRGGTCVSLLHFEPLCALVTDKADPLVQRFTFRSIDDLRVWCAEVCETASARAGEWQVLTAGTSRVLTLVTCASERIGQRERTAVLFAQRPSY